jgi:hypothetical protein
LVYAKPPFARPQQVLNYVGRHTHRIAISNERREPRLPDFCQNSCVLPIRASRTPAYASTPRYLLPLELASLTSSHHIDELWEPFNAHSSIALAAPGREG